MTLEHYPMFSKQTTHQTPKNSRKLKNLFYTIILKCCVCSTYIVNDNVYSLIDLLHGPVKPTKNINRQPESKHCLTLRVEYGRNGSARAA